MFHMGGPQKDIFSIRVQDTHVYMWNSFMKWYLPVCSVCVWWGSICRGLGAPVCACGCQRSTSGNILQVLSTLMEGFFTGSELSS